MFMQKALSKINLRNGDEVFLMVDYKLNSKLCVKILNFQCNEVYVGHLNDIELRSQAARIRLTFDEYSERVIKKALIERISDNLNFLYFLDERDGSYKFQWKSIDEEQTIISLGSVVLKKENFAITMTEMLEMLSVEMCLMKNKIQELSVELNKTQLESSEALRQLQHAAEIKEKLEVDMYSKFVLVLNEKKRKIRELQQTNMHSSHPNTESRTKKQKNTSKLLDSDSSDELEEIQKPGPSTAKNNSFLFLEDEKPILSSSKNRIRSKRIVASKEENKSKSIKNITVDYESDELLFDEL